MLTFRMDETNFADGDRDGIRIATGTGLKVDFDEFATDSDTLGLWHLHDGACQGEGTGLEDDSGGGHDFTNHGAEAVEDGYRFVLADGDYMNAAFAGQPARSQVTLEMWVRGWQTPTGTTGILSWFVTSGNQGVRLYGKEDGASSYIRAFFLTTAGGYGYASWTGSEVHDLLTGAAPWHAALVLDAGAETPYLDLYVNGVFRARTTTNITDMPAGNYTVTLALSSIYSVSAVLDEVRVSSTARYATGFTPTRLLASGVYTGLTFDGVRIAADWTDLVRTQTVPPGSETTWDVCADDETDVNGNPQAVWQPYSGAPQCCPTDDTSSGERRSKPTPTASHRPPSRPWRPSQARPATTFTTQPAPDPSPSITTSRGPSWAQPSPT